SATHKTLAADPMAATLMTGEIAAPPPPRRSRAPWLVGVAVLVALVAVGALYVGRVLNPSAAATRPPSAADGLRTRPTSKPIAASVIAPPQPRRVALNAFAWRGVTSLRNEFGGTL